MQASLKVLWANKNYRIATIIAVVTLLWLISGIFVSGSTPAPKKPLLDASDSAPARTTVRARNISAQLYPLTVSVKGQTEANRDIDLKAEVSGQVEAVPVEKGSIVKTGDVICRLAKEDRELRLAEAQASLDQAQLEYDGALKLKTGGYQSQTAIATSKARLEMTKAEHLRRQLDLQKTQIRAPFDAVVDERPVEIGDLMRPGDVCATLLDLDPLVIAGQVSEQQVIRMARGDEAQARLVTGERMSGRIRYISRDADDTTRSFRVEAAVENPEMSRYVGITAELQVLAAEIPAHHIPASLLSLDDEGALGVRIIDNEKRVRFVNVDMLGDDDKGLWVTGLPEQTLLITVGQEYVANGELVNYTLDEPATESQL